jgi:hypothetical protein
MNTEAAAGLGVSLANERTQKIALAAQAADPNDAAIANLMAKAAVAKRAMAASTAPKVAPTNPTIDMDEPAPTIDDIIEETTLEASTTIESAADTVPIPDGVAGKTPAPKKAAKKSLAKKPAAKNRPHAKHPPRSPPQRKQR